MSSLRSVSSPVRKALLALAVGLCAAPAAPAAEPPTTPPPVTHRSISVTDAQLGPLTFDSVTAGDPALAAQGKLVLLLHGFPESGEVYREVLPKLAAAGYYAVAPFQRGYSAGARPPKDSDYTLDHMVYDTVGIAQALGAPRFHLVGHDWGAAVAWIVAAELPPGIVESLTVLDAPHPEAMREAIKDPLSGQALMFQYINIFKTPGIANVLLAFGPGLFAGALHTMGMPADYANTFAAEQRSPSNLDKALAWYRANPVPAKQVLPSVSVPTTYAWGTGDFAFSKTAARDTAHYVTGPYKFVVMQGQDHFIPEDRPQEVADLTLERIHSTEH